MVNRFDVVLVVLDPTIGHEIQKTRPCVVISPNEMNHGKRRMIIVAPMTSNSKTEVPTHIPIYFKKRQGKIVLEQLRAIDKERVIKPVGKIDKTAQKQIIDCLQEMFHE